MLTNVLLKPCFYLVCKVAENVGCNAGSGAEYNAGLFARSGWLKKAPERISGAKCL
jgi:hypothetical protein